MGSPFVWPKVWKNNPAVKNPHRIYPGNQIWISDNEMRPLAPGEASGFTTSSTGEDAVVKPVGSFPVPAIEDIGLIGTEEFETAGCGARQSGRREVARHEPPCLRRLRRGPGPRGRPLHRRARERTRARSRDGRSHRRARREARLARDHEGRPGVVRGAHPGLERRDAARRPPDPAHRARARGAGSRRRRRRCRRADRAGAGRSHHHRPARRDLPESRHRPRRGRRFGRSRSSGRARSCGIARRGLEPRAAGRRGREPDRDLGAPGERGRGRHAREPRGDRGRPLPRRSRRGDELPLAEHRAAGSVAVDGAHDREGRFGGDQRAAGQGCTRARSRSPRIDSEGVALARARRLRYFGVGPGPGSRSWHSEIPIPRVAPSRRRACSTPAMRARRRAPRCAPGSRSSARLAYEPARARDALARHGTPAAVAARPLRRRARGSARRPRVHGDRWTRSRAGGVRLLPLGAPAYPARIAALADARAAARPCAATRALLADAAASRSSGARAPTRLGLDIALRARARARGARRRRRLGTRARHRRGGASRRARRAAARRSRCSAAAPTRSIRRSTRARGARSPRAAPS